MTKSFPPAGRRPRQSGRHAKGENLMRLLRFFLICVFTIFATADMANAKENNVTIQSGKQVSFDYTLMVDGKVVDSSKDRGPLTYTHGKGEIIDGLSKQLEGMKIGEEKDIAVPPQEAYGNIDSQAFKEYPKTSLPSSQAPQVGMYLQMKSPDGRIFPVRIAEVKKDTVLVDFNHPLAGKTLNFQVKIISIQ